MLTTPGTEVAHDVGVVIAVDIHAIAVALQHLIRRTIGGDDIPHVQRHTAVPRSACLSDRRTKAFQLCHCGANQGVYLRFGHAGNRKTFAQQADFQAGNALIEGRDTTDRRRVFLP